MADKEDEELPTTSSATPKYKIDTNNISNEDHNIHKRSDDTSIWGTEEYTQDTDNTENQKSN